MADGYDRFDNDSGGGGSFVMGLLTGTVLGAGLGMLFAPKAGHELRNQLSEQANKLGQNASDQYRKAADAASGWAEKGKQAYDQASEKGREVVDKAKDAVAKGADEAQRYARDAAAGATGSSPSSSSFGSSSYGDDRGPSGSRRS